MAQPYRLQFPLNATQVEQLDEMLQILFENAGETPLGATGASGAAGASGSGGAAGAQGPPGASGEDGDDGAAGPPGAQGPAGAAGASGPAGPVTLGPMGLHGDDGVDGLPIPGPQGVQGIQGIQGPAGPPTLGPMGLDGEDGEMGMPIPGPAGAAGADGAGGSLVFLKTTSQQVINAGAGVYTDVTGLTFSVVNGNTYGFKFYVVWRSAALATGFKSSLNCPAGTLDFWSKPQTIQNSATTNFTTWVERHSFTRDDMTTLVSSVGINQDLVVLYEGRYICTEDGTFAVRFANELVANTDITVEAGSWGFYWIQ